MATQGDSVVIRLFDGGLVTLAAEAPVAQGLGTVLAALDGTRTFGEAAADARSEVRQLASGMLAELARRDLVDDLTLPEGMAGLDVLHVLEDEMEQRLEETVFRGRYWTALSRTDVPPPRSVLVGTAIENFHFLVHEPFFDSPALGFQESRAARTVFNQFYVSESGHDRLILSALAAIGLDAERIENRCIPLATTAALCNTLAHLASADPLTFFATIGLLEGTEARLDGFVSACERWEMEPGFVNPLRAHAMINAEAAHGRLARHIFRPIPCVPPATIERMSRQCRLVVDLYHEFYEGIWNHYSSARDILRMVDEERAT